MSNLLVSELEKIQELDKISTVITEVVNTFLTAINDWSNPILELEDYELEVRNFIGASTSKVNIVAALNKIDFSKNSWQAESLIQIVDVFQFYNEGMSLKEIIMDLKIQ